MITFGTNGLVIDDLETILEEVQTDFRVRFGVSIATALQSSAGQLQRLWAQRESNWQETMLQLYQALDPRLAEGTPLDQRNSIVGVSRQAAQFAEVLGTATGTPSTSIPDGHRVSVGGNVFQVADGPYVIGGGGTIGSVKVVAEELGPIDVSVLGAWTLVDTLSGFDSFDDDSQPVAGRLVEIDADYRTRTDVERFARGQGPLVAIEAAVSAVKGVSFVKAFHNITTDPLDGDLIPFLAINVVVRGGLDAEVAQAIWDAGPAGHLFFGTDVSETVVEGVSSHIISFDRVSDITLHIDVVATTTTSEENAPDDLEALVRTRIQNHADVNQGIGTDVYSGRYAGALSDILGVDLFTVTSSFTGSGFIAAKRAIGIRDQGVLIDARITFSED